MPAQVLADARAGTGAEEVVLDENELAGDGDFFALGVLDPSPDQELLAYALDRDGSERYTLRFRRITPGQLGDLPDTVEGVTYGSAWATDSAHLFYTRPDDAMRPFQVFEHQLFAA